MAILSFVLRGFQFLFGIVVLGLSVTLLKGHHWGPTPASLGFSAVVGGISILGALIGLAGVWVSFLEGIVGLAVDAVVALINIAGGVYFAIRLGGVECKNNDNEANARKLGTNEWFNGGYMKIDGQKYPWVSQYDSAEKIVSVILGHCREAQATTVFMFLTAIVFLVSGVMLFLRNRK